MGERERSHHALGQKKLEPGTENAVLLYDHRTYTCRPGTIRKALDLYLQHGFEVQKRHLGNPVLSWLRRC